MPHGDDNPLLAPFLAAADSVRLDRPDVDPELARELMHEAAVMLHNGLALDGLDADDTATVADGLARALIAVDPGEAVRARAAAALADPQRLHAPEDASRSYLVAAAILRL